MAFPVFLANVGTTLVWAEMLHLVLGNAVIGLFEAWLLSRFFGAKIKTAAPLIILANYVSAWVGFTLLPVMTPSFVTIENLRSWFVVMLFGAFVITLAIELPFFRVVLRRANRVTSALKATVLVHLASYLVLVAGYVFLSSASLVTELQMVDAHEIAPESPHEIYFISKKGDEVLRIGLDGGDAQLVVAIGDKRKASWLFPVARKDGRFDLGVYFDERSSGGSREKILVEDFASLVADSTSQDSARPIRSGAGLTGEAPRFNPATPWVYRAGFMAVEGISGRNLLDESRFRFSIETPFTAWRVRNATHLENDSVVFQLGSSQICILQPQQKKIALIARGREPVVAIPHSESATPPVK